MGFLVTDAGTDTLAGRAPLVDGDTIEIHGERLRILDIGALEPLPQKLDIDLKPGGRIGQAAEFSFIPYLRGIAFKSNEDFPKS